MSTTVDSRVVEMRFDNKQFEANVQTSLKTLNDLKKGLDLSDSAKGLESISKASSKVSFDGLASGIETVRAQFSFLDVAAATVFSSITSAVMRTADSIVSSMTSSIRMGFSEYETQINSVQTILANTQATTKQVVKQVSADVIEGLQQRYAATVSSNEAALASTQKAHKEELRSFEKTADAEIDAIEEKHDTLEEELKATHKAQLKEYEKQADELLEVLEEEHESALEALEESLEEEMKLFKASHEEKLDLYNEEYLQKLKVIDEERYNRLKAVDDQIDAINKLTEEEEKALKIEEQNAKLAQLQYDIDNAETYEARVTAEEKLVAYKAKLAREQLLEERKAQLDALKLTKDDINEEYDAKAEALKQEYDAKKTAEKELYDIELENLKKKQEEEERNLKKIQKQEKDALKEQNQLDKESIQAQQDIELAALKKTHEEEKKLIKERLDLEKEAIQEQQSAAIAAMKASQKAALESISQQMSQTTYVETVSVKPSTLEDVNAALDELNKYADKTIYNFTEMTRNIGTFTAAGIDLDTSVSAIKGIANLAAVSGSTSQQASTAMYQLSQALASGTVKLMDWNSVVNAGMGGQVFQDALKETARVHGIAVDDLIAKNGSFRESLSTGWLTADVLTETLEKFTMCTDDMTESQIAEARAMYTAKGYTDEQIDAIFKMGKTATDAATKVKTFSQLMDTLNESKQSGWTQTWEIILGDFEEARALFTEISTVFGGMIEASANARNEMLQGWKDLGGRTALIDSVRNVFVGLMNIVTPIKEAFTEIFPPTTSEQLYNITIALKNLTEKFKNSTNDTSALKSTFKGLFAILDIGKQIIGAVFSVFKPVAKETGSFGGVLLKVTGAIGDWLVKLSETTRQTEVFKTALSAIIAPFKSVINIIKEIASSNEMTEFLNAVSTACKKIGDSLINSFKSGVELVKNFANTVKERFGLVSSDFGSVEEAIKSLGKKFLTTLTNLINGSVNFGERVKSAFTSGNSVISAFGTLVSGVIGTAVTKLSEFINSVKERFDFPGLDLFSTFLTSLKEKTDGVKSSVGDMKTNVVTSVQEMGEAISNSPIVRFFKDLWEGIKTLASGIGTLIGGVASGLGEVFTGASFLEIISGISIGGVAIGIVQLTKSIKNIFDDLGGITENFVGILNSIQGCFEAYQNSLNADALMKIATAIGILAAAIIVLAMVDAAKLNESILAITTLFAELMVSMKIMGKNSANIAAMSVSCIALSAAVAVMAGTLAALSGLDPASLVTGITAVGALSAIVVASAKIMSRGTDQITKGTAGLVIFAAAVKVLASACKDLAELDVPGLVKGLTGVGVLFAEIGVFLNFAKFDSGTTSTAAGILVLTAALKILADVAEDFAGMSIGGMIQGLGGVGVLLAEIAVFTNLVGSPEKLISTATGMTILGAAMKIIASVVEDLGSMEWTDMVLGLGGMGVALVGMIAAIELMPNNMLSKSAALVVMATAIAGLSGALKIMGSMNPMEMIVALIALAGALASLAFGLNAMNTTLAGSAALLVAANAMLVMAPALKLLGNLTWTEIGVGLITLAAAMGVLGAAAALLTPVIPGMVSLAAAFALLGAGTLGIGAGLLAAGAGIAALAAGLAAIAGLGAAAATAIVEALNTIILGVVNTIVAIGAKLGEAVVAFAQAIVDGAPVIGEALLAIKTAVSTIVIDTITLVVEAFMTLITKLITAIADSAPEICEGFLSILETIAEYTPDIVKAFIDILVGFREAIAEKIPDLISSAVDLMLAFIKGINSKLPDICQAGFEMFITFIQGITKALNENTPMLVETMNELFVALLKAALEVLEGGIKLIWEGGKALIDSGLIQGALSMLGNLVIKIGELIAAGVKAVKDKLGEWLQAGKDLIGKIISGIGEKISAFNEKVTEAIAGGIKAIKDKFAEWYEAGKDLLVRVTKGIGAKVSAFKEEVTDAITGGVDAAKEQLTAWKNIGIDAMKGLIKGVKDKAKDVVKSVKDVVKDALKGAKNLLGIKSPSRKFAEIGKYSDEGLVMGLKAYAGKVTGAAKDVGSNMLDAISSTVSSISDIITDDDWEPMIRPVIDLTNVEAGARSIEAMFSRTQAMELGAQMRAAETRNHEIADGETSTSGNSYQFVQNNYSPKALSRIDIYRQTKNQFSALERMAAT